jgi:hypothetical protein
VRTPAAWPLYKVAADLALRPETTPGAPLPLEPHQSQRTAEPLLKRPAPADESLPSPPSLESILAAASFDKPTNRQGPAWWRNAGFSIARLASLGVLVPCLVGAGTVMLFPALAAPRATAIGADREDGVPAGELGRIREL